MAAQATISTRRIPGVPSAIVAQEAQPTPQVRTWRTILAELEDKLDSTCKELATVPVDGGQVANYLTDRWSANLRFWIVARVFLLREQSKR